MLDLVSFLFSLKTLKAIRAHFHALIIFLLALFGNSPGLPPERKHSHQRKRAALDTRLHKCYKMNKRCAVSYRFFHLVILRKRKPPVRVRADRRFAFICRSSCHIHICFCPPFCQIKVVIKINALSEPMVIPFLYEIRIKAMILDTFLSRRRRSVIPNNLIFSFFFQHRIACLVDNIISQFLQPVSFLCKRENSFSTSKRVHAAKA